MLIVYTTTNNGCTNRVCVNCAWASITPDGVATKLIFTKPKVNASAAETKLGIK